MVDMSYLVTWLETTRSRGRYWAPSPLPWALFLVSSQLVMHNTFWCHFQKLMEPLLPYFWKILIYYHKYILDTMLFSWYPHIIFDKMKKFIKNNFYSIFTFIHNFIHIITTTSFSLTFSSYYPKKNPNFENILEFLRDNNLRRPTFLFNNGEGMDC